MFLETVSPDKAKKYIAAGRKAWEYKTKNVHAGPIFGPAYDDKPAVNRARKAQCYAETLEEAQRCAKALGTEIAGVVFIERE
ncbi:MAG: hypothetical protein ACE14L_02520 [Terriglobales bacterium]